MTLPLSSIGCGLLLAAYFLWQDKGEAVQELKKVAFLTLSLPLWWGWPATQGQRAQAIPSIVAIHSFNSYDPGYRLNSPTMTH